MFLEALARVHGCASKSAWRHEQGCTKALIRASVARLVSSQHDTSFLVAIAKGASAVWLASGWYYTTCLGAIVEGVV